MSIEDDVRQFLVKDLSWSGSADQLTSDFPLIENDVLDSMGIFELVTMLEQRYGVDIEDEELTLDNFGTLRSIARLVGTKSGS